MISIALSFLQFFLIACLYLVKMRDFENVYNDNKMQKYKYRWNCCWIFILFGLIHSANQQKVSSQLQLLTYEPLKFNLSFTKPVKLPKFQLLFNQININYNVTNINDIGANYSYFILQANLDELIVVDRLLTEKYKVLFTEPLRVADGKLDLNSFVIRAQEVTLSQFNYIGQPYKFTYNLQQQSPALNNLSISIISLVYILTFSTVIGIHAYNFIIIFIFISLQGPLFTALDYRCAYYLLFQTDQVTNRPINRIAYLLIPYMFLALSFCIGVIFRVKGKKLIEKSYVWKEVYYYFSYRYFIITWDIMCMPMFVNVTHLIRHRELVEQIGPYFAYPFIYISLVLIALYSYMAYMTVNPQIGQPASSWSSYTQSSHFQLFYGFHLGIDAKNWKKRNFTFIVSLFRILIISLVCAQLVNVPNLILQILYLIYLFTLRPFKYNFFNHCIIGIQIVVILFYMFRYLVVLYRHIGQQIITNSDFSKILTTNVIWLCLIIFTYFVLGVYQLFRRVQQFKIHVADSRRRQTKQKIQYKQILSATTNRSQLIKQQSHHHSPKSSKLRHAASQKLIGTDNKLIHSIDLKASNPLQKSIQSPTSSRKRNKQSNIQSPNVKNTKSTPFLLKQSIQINQKLQYDKNMNNYYEEEGIDEQIIKQRQIQKSRQKTNKIKKNKEKSSLLQSISMGRQHT